MVSALDSGSEFKSWPVTLCSVLGYMERSYINVAFTTRVHTVHKNDNHGAYTECIEW